MPTTPATSAPTLGLDRRVWYRVREGIEGLLTTDEHGVPTVYMMCGPASHYYEMMTRSPRMAVLVNQQI